MRRRKKMCMILGGLMACLLTGCSPTELEERTFPLVVMVDYQADKNQVVYYAGLPKVDTAGKEMVDTEVQVQPVSGRDFEESKELFEESLNKKADYNHLKVLVLGESLIQQPAQYEALLDRLAEDEEFPRNTYVCVVGETDALQQMESNLPLDLGTYLEEFLNNHEKSRKAPVTLGDMLDEKENKKLVLHVPYLEPTESYVQWMRDYIVTFQKNNE